MKGMAALQAAYRRDGLRLLAAMNARIILVAVDISLIAWLAQNFQSAEIILVVLAFLAVVGTTAAIVAVNHAAYKRIAELENL